MHTFSYYEVMFCTKRGLQVGNEYHFRSTYGHKTNSELTVGRRLSYYAFRRRGFSNVTINELKNVIESEIQGPASMRGCRAWVVAFIKNKLVQRNIAINILKEKCENLSPRSKKVHI